MRFKFGRIRNLDGELVDRSEKAEILAQYFTKIQWQVQFPDYLLSHLPNAASELSVNTDDISHEELISILKKFKKKKALGEDNIPIEFWAYIIGHEEARTILLDILNDC